MKAGFWRFARLTLGFLIFSTATAAQTHRQNPDPCKDTSKMTQGEMNECTFKGVQKAELKLERLLKQLGIDKDSPEQRAWEAYRDAQLAALYPPENISGHGSIYPLCVAIVRKALTQGRIRDLKALLRQGEGDTCYGYRVSSSRADNSLEKRSKFDRLNLTYIRKTLAGRSGHL